MKYFTLLARENNGSEWSIQFGDYELETVQFEAKDIRENEGLRVMIMESEDDQESINRKLSTINFIHQTCGLHTPHSHLD